MHADEAKQGKKVLVVQGLPNPSAVSAGDPFPALDGRPVDLRPESLPGGTRYIFADDAVVVAAAKLVSDHLLMPTKGKDQLFSDAVIVNSGAWKVLKSRGSLGKKSAKAVVNAAPMGSKVLKLEAMFLQDREEIGSLEQTISDLVKIDGGGRVRALKTTEMRKWWAFIAFDITEPVFVLETKNKAHLFILDFGKDGLVLSIDELNGLPN